MISGGRLAIRTAARPASVAGVVRDAGRAADPAVRVTRIAPYPEYLRVPLAWPRFNALLLGVQLLAASSLPPWCWSAQPSSPPGRQRGVPFA